MRGKGDHILVVRTTVDPGMQKMAHTRSSPLSRSQAKGATSDRAPWL